MAEWQRVLHERSLSTLRQRVEKFGAEHFPDLDRLQQAVDNFEFRISPPMVGLIKEPGSGKDFKVVDIPPGMTHSIENTGTAEMIVLFWASEILDGTARTTHFSEVLRG